MASVAVRTETIRPWVTDKIFLGMPLGDYLRGLLTPFNVVAAAIMAVGVPVIAYRFLYGLGAVTNLSQSSPWGLWIGLDMLCGVALAAGGYTIAAAVYVFGLEQFRPIVRPAILTGFLGYVFAVLGLLADLGQPWRIAYPIFYSAGPTSVMYEVGWCVAVYTTVLMLEFTPVVFEWLGLKKLRNRMARLTVGLTVFGLVLSTLHQSSLGALFLLTPTKLHPLWHSSFIPLYFFITSIAAGLSMVILESGLSHRLFHHRVDQTRPVDLDGLTLSLSRAAAVVLFTYFFLKLQGLADSGDAVFLPSGYGAWYLFELVGLALVPCFLFAHAARTANARLARWAAGLTVLGVVLNRLNVSIITMGWQDAVRYVPSWMEFVTSLTIITAGVLTFRWVVNRMPVLAPHPDYRNDAH